MEARRAKLLEMAERAYHEHLTEREQSVSEPGFGDRVRTALQNLAAAVSRLTPQRMVLQFPPIVWLARY